MKIEQIPNKFQPFKIVIESEEELEVLRATIGLTKDTDGSGILDKLYDLLGDQIRKNNVLKR